MIFKSLFIVFISIFFTACSVENYNLYSYKNSINNGKNTISLNLMGIEKKIELTNPKYENTYSSCSQDTYTLFDDNYNYGKLFIENIDLSFNCQWNGLASGYFVYEFKNRNKFKSFELVNRFLKQNFEVSTYLVDGEKYVDIIDIFSVNKNTLIIDERGKLAYLIISNLDPKYEYKYLDKPRLDFNYNYSLVQNNMLFSYFGYESLNDDYK